MNLQATRFVVFGCLPAMMAACGAFTSDAPPTPAPPDAALDAPGPFVDGSPRDDAGEPPGDGGSTGGLSLPCPRPPGPSKSISGSARRLLDSPGSGVRLPWGITTDADYVYWVTQPATNDGYNGQESASIWRVRRNGGPTERLAESQLRTRVVARDGEHVYWFDQGGGRVTLKRVRRDATCAGACAAPEEIGRYNTGAPVSKIVRVAKGVLFAITEQGDLLRADLAAKTLTPAWQSSSFPTLTATDTHVYFGSAQRSLVERSDHDGRQKEPFFGIPSVDGGTAGVALLESDCNALWGMRIPMGDLVTIPLAAATLSTVMAAVAPRAYDLVTDQAHVYIARADDGGVFAYNPSVGYVPVYRGNVFAMAVDDQGLYWGEHDQATGGAIHMLVK